MTLLNVYNKNGHCRENEASAYGFSDLLNEFSYRNYCAPGSNHVTPRVNIREETDSFQIEMDIPGIDKNQVKMNLSKDLLTISYKNEESIKEEKFTHREFNYQNFERSFRLPESIDKEKITASYSEGILLVNLLKKDEAVEKGPRNIDIS